MGQPQGGSRRRWDWRLGRSRKRLRPLAGNSERQKFGCLLETPVNPTVLLSRSKTSQEAGDIGGSDKPIGADNQQGSRRKRLLTPQRLHAEPLDPMSAADVKMASTEAGANQCKGEDIVHASRRRGDQREQGSRTGRCGWITSFLGIHTIGSFGISIHCVQSQVDRLEPQNSSVYFQWKWFARHLFRDEPMGSHRLTFIVTTRRAVPATFHRLTIAQAFAGRLAQLVRALP